VLAGDVAEKERSEVLSILKQPLKSYIEESIESDEVVSVVDVEKEDATL
jgi:hypothetical protein